MEKIFLILIIIKLINLLKKITLLLEKYFSKKKKRGNLESIMIDLLQECFPSCFLEDFTLIKDFYKKRIKKIKYVFTSNEFALNEFFFSFI